MHYFKTGQARGGAPEGNGNRSCNTLGLGREKRQFKKTKKIEKTKSRVRAAGDAADDRVILHPRAVKQNNRSSYSLTDGSQKC